MSEPLSKRHEDDAYAERAFKAMMLAKRVEDCAALLRGESVPVDRLDPEWVERFGRRPS